MSRDTKTVELPLTKSEQRHKDSMDRQATKRRRGQIKQESMEARDAKLLAVNEDYGPKIRKLQEERKDALKKIWDEWKKERSESV